MSIPDALHAPSTAMATATATATRPPPPTEAPTLQTEVARLTELKRGIEAQLDAYFDVLKSASHVCARTHAARPRRLTTHSTPPQTEQLHDGHPARRPGRVPESRH